MITITCAIKKFCTFRTRLNGEGKWLALPGADPGLTVGGCLGYTLHTLARAKFYVPHPLLALFPHARAHARAFELFLLYIATS